MTDGKRLILASASRRRRVLFSRLSLPFEVRPVDVDEEFGDQGNPEIVARRLARTKAEAARLLETEAPIVAADTVVAIDGLLLGKPSDPSEARLMLQRLRNREHDVVTAVAIMRAGGRAVLARQPVTHVRMRDYEDAEIEASISRGDPFDKAGAYAIQDELFRAVDNYDGCYCNVIGLSLWATLELLRKADVNISHVMPSDLLPQCSACPLRPPDV
jgi:MAF protein